MELKFGVTAFTIEECSDCGDPEFAITAGELDDAEGYVECDICGKSRFPLTDEDYGLEPPVY